MLPLTKNCIPTMLAQPKGKCKYVVEASKEKIIQDCMRIQISDGDNETKALIQLKPDKPWLDLRKVGKPYG